MVVSIRLNEEDEKIIKTYAELNNLSLSDCFRNAVLEKIEEEYDLKSLKEAIEEYRKNPKTYTIEEAKRELGL